MAVRAGCLAHLQLAGLGVDAMGWLQGAHGLLSLNLTGGRSITFFVLHKWLALLMTAHSLLG